MPDSVAEAQKEQWRLWCCLRNDAWPVFERKPMRIADAQRRAALSFDKVTGVAAVELGGVRLYPAHQVEGRRHDGVQVAVRKGADVLLVDVHALGVRLHARVQSACLCAHLCTCLRACK